jgi:hypothetical protein
MQIASAFGIPATNYGLSGYTAAALGPTIYARTPSGTDRQMFTFMSGVADILLHGVAATYRDQWATAAAAEVAWLALPSTAKKNGTTFTFITSANWTTLTPAFSIGARSGTNGEIAATFLYGSTVLLAVAERDGDAGTFNITIDALAFNNNSTTPTVAIGGTGTGPRLYVFAGLSDTIHQVYLTVTSATSAVNTVEVDWAAGITGRGQVRGGPIVYWGGPTRGTNIAPDADVAGWNNAARTKAKTFQSLGMNVAWVDTENAMIQSEGALGGDSIHPVQVGCDMLANVNLATMNPLVASPGAKGYVPMVLGDGRGNAFIPVDGSDLYPALTFGSTYDPFTGFRHTGTYGLAVSTAGVRTMRWEYGTASPTTTLDGTMAYTEVTTAALAGNVDNYAGCDSATMCRVDSGGAARNITGLTGGVSGREVTICAVNGTGALTLKHQVTSTATNQFKFSGATDRVVAVDECRTVTYDATTTRWREKL